MIPKMKTVGIKMILMTTGAKNITPFKIKHVTSNPLVPKSRLGFCGGFRLPHNLFFNLSF
jgi:hypothetical protein